MRKSTLPEFKTQFWEKDEPMAIIPEGYSYSNSDSFPVEVLCDELFMPLEKGAKTEISAIFETSQSHAQCAFQDMG